MVVAWVRGGSVAGYSGCLRPDRCAGPG